MIKRDSSITNYNENLEELVESRTEGLIAANQKLKQEILERNKTEAKLRKEK